MITHNIKKGDRLFDIVNILILTGTLLLVLYPLYFILIASISNPNNVYNGEVILIPKGITFEGYFRIFNDEGILTGYRNSIFYTFTGTLINLLITIPAAYALSRKDLDGRKTFMLFLIFTMYFNGGLIPTYLLVRKLGLINKIWAMVLPNALAVWNLIIARSFFENQLPGELREASVMDGCTDFKYFMKIVLPLSKALIAVMALFYGVNHWNAYFNALIYLREQSRFPLQLILRNILIQNDARAEMMTDISAISEQQRIADLIKYGVIIVASIPMLIMYPLLQKYFVKGVMIGSIKG